MIGSEQLKSIESHLFDVRDPSMEGKSGLSESELVFRETDSSQ